MGSAVHQLASASIAAVFSLGMLFAAHLFTEYRSGRVAALVPVPQRAIALEMPSRFDGNSFPADGRNGAI